MSLIAAAIIASGLPASPYPARLSRKNARIAHHIEPTTNPAMPSKAPPIRSEHALKFAGCEFPRIGYERTPRTI